MSKKIDKRNLRRRGGGRVDADFWEKIGNHWRAERARNQQAKFDALEKERRNNLTAEEIKGKKAAARAEARAYRARRVAEAAQRHPNLSPLRAYKMELAEASYEPRTHVAHPERETRTLCGRRFNQNRDSSFDRAYHSLEFHTEWGVGAYWICAKCIRGWERVLDAGDQRRFEELMRNYEYRAGLRGLLRAAFGGDQRERSVNGETEVTQKASTAAPRMRARLPHRLETSLIQQRRPLKDWINAARRQLGVEATHAELADALFGSLVAIRERAPQTHGLLLRSPLLWHEREQSVEESDK